MAFSEGYLHSPEYQRWQALQDIAGQQQPLYSPMATMAKALQGGIAGWAGKKSQATYDAKEANKASLLASLLQDKPVSDVAVTPALNNPGMGGSGPEDYSGALSATKAAGQQYQTQQASGAYNQPTSQAPNNSEILSGLLAGKNPDAIAAYAPMFAQAQIQQNARANEPITPFQKAQLGFEAQRMNPANIAAQAKAQRETPEERAASAQALLPSQQALKASPGAPAEAMTPEALQQQLQLKNAGQVLSPEAEAQRIRISAAEAKAKADAVNAPYDPETIGFMADQAWAGDKSVFQQMGYGAAGQSNRAALRNAVTQKGLAMNKDGRDIAALNAEFSGLQAGERTLGNRTANIEMAVTEAQQMAPLALQASGRVNRTQFPTLNSILLAGEKGVGGEDVVRLGVATNSLINIYARAISPTGVPTVSDKDHARELLSSAWANGQYSAGVDQMMKELSAARAAPGAVRGEFRSAIGGGQPGAAMVPDAPINPPSGNQGVIRYDAQGNRIQ